MSFLINPYRFAAPYDTDAQAYITAVETADGQALETGVKDAINAFVVGCKSDGIWSALAGSCILAGARTLNGALIPIRGATPSNISFAGSDYNRKTGLIGNGSSKYLNTNVSASGIPRDSIHFSVYKTSTDDASGALIGALAGNDYNYIDFRFACRNQTATNISTTAAGLYAAARLVANSFDYYTPTVGLNTAATGAQPVAAGSFFVFARNLSGSLFHSSQRLAFYSVGTYASPTALASRVTSLINALAIAIP